MLRLVDIVKDYKVADSYVRALRGLNLSFRANEFVSILGPSGCGKTTLLNLIGGLDHCTSGDLFIAGRSTRQFRDHDWDVYRNHRIGFVFQSYNLIPHQTVLGNVELALTIAGMSRVERVAKAKAALDRVGLSDQYYKRPNQLSGGQCQRVAIARALVNDPDILLADEPTGALDTTTSTQIMELIRQIAREKLVIMVTHNPELAEHYSTRIIRLLDGELQSDSNPFDPADEIAECQAAAEQLAEQPKVKKQKAKMSFWTAFRLSLQNLFTKKARTIMTSVAGSIGIIGVSLVLSISYGVQAFINDMQNDMLSGNPITISESGFDLTALLQMSSTETQREALERLPDMVNVDELVAYLASRADDAQNIVFDNEITPEYIEYVLSLSPDDAAAIFLDFGLDINYSIFTDYYIDADTAPQRMSLSTIKQIYTSVLQKSPQADYAAYIASIGLNFAQAPSNTDYIMTQYDLQAGRIATAANEVMIVLQRESELSDILLAQLGYFSQEEFLNIVFRATPDADGTPNTNYDPALDKHRFGYDELLAKEFVWYPNSALFAERTPFDPSLPFVYNAYEDSSFSGGLELEVVGILEPKSDVSYGCLSSGFYYTEALTQHILGANRNSRIVEVMAEQKWETISSGADASLPGGQRGITYEYSFTYPYVNDPSTEQILFENQVGYFGTTSSMASMLGMMGSFMTNPAMQAMLESIANMRTITPRQLGGAEIASRIAIYPVDFERKQNVLAHLDAWNSDRDLTFVASSGQKITLKADERSKIEYSDTLSLIIDMINNLISIITFALVGFTSLSLVVSCVMIAIITYVSVVERIKEIGVIRSLGGRKRDVSYLFNAETFIIGLVSGLIGIIVTYLVSWLINIAIYAAQGITAIAIFPWFYALTMVGVSIGLTLISGLMPASSAAKKDPVVALRTE